jgi:septum formation topological specificity factor MinE
MTQKQLDKDLNKKITLTKRDLLNVVANYVSVSKGISLDKEEEVNNMRAFIYEDIDENLKAMGVIK